MNQTLLKFCKEIDFILPENQQNSCLNEVVQETFLDSNNNKQERIIFDISFFVIPTLSELSEFYQKTKKFFHPLDVDFKFNLINKNYSKERICDLLEFGFQFLLLEKMDKYIDKNSVDYNVNDKVLNISFYSKEKLNNYLKNEKLFVEIKKLLNIDDIQFNVVDLSNDILDDAEKQYNEEAKNHFDQLKLNKGEQNDQKTTNPNSFQLKNTRKYFSVNLEEFYTTHERNLVVEGKVFFCEKIVTKTGLEIISINITDFNEAINAKLFLRNNKENNFEWLKEGEYVSIWGEKKVDYTSQQYLQISKIEKRNYNDSIKIDDAKKKRIEFSTRTSMSAMDGFLSPKEFLMGAKNLNHEAIAFVDYQNIQAFPEIYNNASKIGIKPIYGCTFSVIERDNKIIWNPKHGEMIKNERYIIFDLETTSLNPRTGEIIEFGAVIMDNNIVVETIQFFVKTTKPISKFTTELTGITQKMIDEQAQYNQQEAILKIKEIFSRGTLVAHNAQFDIGFINEKLFQMDMDELSNQIIDTMSLSKFIFPNSMSYRLEVISKKANVLYDPTIAHRADYDAAILQRVWVFLIENLARKSITTFDQIFDISSNEIHGKKFAHDLTIYAKNQEGLRELFKLVSISCTTNYFNGPKLFEDELKKSSNLIMGPASINSRLMDLMHTGTTKELVKEIQKWDFIGIPSPHLFSHLIARENFSEEELKKWLKEIVLIAKKMSKLIIAVGDVRYIDKRDALAHKVYINTKGVEGKRHSLYKYNETNPKYPIQSFLTTNEMKEQFDFLNSQDLVEEIVVTNTHILNEQIDNNIQVIKSKLYPPKFDESEKKLVDLVYENAHNIYGEKLPKIVEERIERELAPINKFGFSVVYWISSKLVAKSNQDGYLVGSRGSVGSSLVATLSKITEVNPLPPHYVCLSCKYSDFEVICKTSSGFDLEDKNCPNCGIKLSKNGQTIPFETFLGFDGDKVPDIDLNFSGEYQPIIHQEVKRMFGEDHSFRAGTISTVASKTAFGFVKKWVEESNLDKSNIFIGYLSQRIEGSKRTTGQHPGGIIIIPKEFDVEDFTPINYPANDLSSSWRTTHFDFHAIHDNVLKLDLLGHDDPTAIKHLQKLTNVKIEEISFSDEKVLELFSSTKPLNINPEDINNEPTGVLGIPEFGTKFVRRMLGVAKPQSFNDLINLSGLSHGTDVWNGNAEELIKAGKSLNDVISCRDDIMVNLIKKSVDPLKAFNIMEKVRKGKGLNADDEEILKSANIEKWYIDSMNKIKYMFPKAHAIAYVMMAWRIAWFKIYYPLEYYATYFTVRIDIFDLEPALGTKEQVEKRLIELEQKQRSKTEKISAKEEELIPIFEIINEMMARGYKIANIDLNKSNATEWLIDYEKNQLIPPFTALDGLGEAAAKSVIKAREERKFSSIDDVQRRTLLNKTTIDKLIKMNVFSDLDATDQITLF